MAMSKSEREAMREAYEVMREASPKSKRSAPEVEVPLLPRSTKKPPKRFQKALDRFNKSAGEQLFVYWNPRSVPKVSGTVNVEGSYTVLGWEGRWELWRPVTERMPLSVYAALHPMVIEGKGPAVKLWVMQENERQVVLQHSSGAQQVFRVGDARQPDQRDIKRLRLCDLYRERPGAVLRELLDDPNEALTAEGERELDELAQDLASYYWSKGGGIYAVNFDPKAAAQPAKTKEE